MSVQTILLHHRISSSAIYILAKSIWLDLLCDQAQSVDVAHFDAAKTRSEVLDA